MTEHERDELEEARHQELIEHAEDIKKILSVAREHSAAEHGAIVARVDDQNRETRAHVASEIQTVSGTMGHIKNYMERLLKAMKRFLSRMGMNSDDL